MTAAELAGMPPLQRAVQAAAIIADLGRQQAEMAQVRRAAVRELRDSGWSAPAIAAHLGVSRAHVYAMLGR